MKPKRKEAAPQESCSEPNIFDAPIPNSIKALIFQLIGGNIPLSRLMNDNAKLVLCDDESRSFHWFDLPPRHTDWERAVQNCLLFSLSESADITSRIIIDVIEMDGEHLLGVFAKEDDDPHFRQLLISMEPSLSVKEESSIEMVMIPTSVAMAKEPMNTLCNDELGPAENHMLSLIEVALTTDVFDSKLVPEA